MVRPRYAGPGHTTESELKKGQGPPPAVFQAYAELLWLRATAVISRYRCNVPKALSPAIGALEARSTHTQLRLNGPCPPGQDSLKHTSGARRYNVSGEQVPNYQRRCRSYISSISAMAPT